MPFIAPNRKTRTEWLNNNSDSCCRTSSAASRAILLSGILMPEIMRDRLLVAMGPVAEFNASPRRRAGRGRRSSIRPDHLEHVFRLDLDIVAASSRTHDRAGQSGLVDAVPDHGLVDVDGDDLAECQPGLRLLA